MSRAYKCDRCGHLGEYAPGTVQMDISQMYNVESGPTGEKDLCHSCSEELKMWWENE